MATCKMVVGATSKKKMIKVSDIATRDKKSKKRILYE
jgi:hypothetical protein